MQDATRRHVLAADWAADTSLQNPETGSSPPPHPTPPLGRAPFQAFLLKLSLTNLPGAVLCWAMDGFNPRSLPDGPPENWPCDAVYNSPHIALPPRCPSSILNLPAASSLPYTRARGPWPIGLPPLHPLMSSALPP
jgi:hypothetical protein